MNISSVLSPEHIRGGSVSENPKVTLKAIQAIVIYEGYVTGAFEDSQDARSGTSSNTVMSRHYAQSYTPRKSVVMAGIHDIHHETNRNGEVSTTKPPMLGPLQSLSTATADLIFRTLTEQETAQERRREMIPSELLYTDTERMVWYRPARRHPIWFRTGRAEFDKELSGKEVLWPSLIFCAEAGGSISAWALATSTERPTPDTPLHYAPLGNFYNTGAMCVGNIAMPRVVGTRHIAAWERAIYETEFTHSNYGATKYHAHPKGQEELWREMKDRGVSEGFPASYLVPAIASGSASRLLTVGEVIAK